MRTNAQVSDLYNKYHAFVNGHVSVDGWPAVIITHLCNSGLMT